MFSLWVDDESVSHLVKLVWERVAHRITFCYSMKLIEYLKFIIHINLLCIFTSTFTEYLIAHMHMLHNVERWSQEDEVHRIYISVISYFAKIIIHREGRTSWNLHISFVMLICQQDLNIYICVEFLEFRIMKGRVLILAVRKGEGAGGRWGYQALSWEELGGLKG